MFANKKSCFERCFIKKNKCICKYIAIHPSLAWGQCSKFNQNNLLPKEEIILFEIYKDVATKRTLNTIYYRI